MIEKKQQQSYWVKSESGEKEEEKIDLVSQYKCPYRIKFTVSFLLFFNDKKNGKINNIIRYIFQRVDENESNINI